MKLFGSPINSKVRSEFDHVASNMKNPYTDLKLWIKFQFLEIEAFAEAVAGGKRIEKQLF